MTWTPLTRCRGCDSAALEPVVELGMLPLVNAFEPIGSSVPATLYPHTIVWCSRCGLAQQSGRVDAETLFGRSYPYRSSVTRALRDNFAGLYAEHQKIAPLGPDDLVVDIGGNDGNLLSHFLAHRTLNVTPEDMGKLGEERGIAHHQAYWGPETAREVVNKHGQAKLITATNVFAHTPSPSDFLEGVTHALAPGGIFASESHYLPGLLRGNQWDTLYLEHDRFLSLQSIRHQLAAHDMQILGARSIPTHGGSIRVYAMRCGEVNALALRAFEKLVREGVPVVHEETVTLADFATFRAKVVQHRRDMQRLIGDIRRLGMSIVGIGAPSRAATLIGYDGLSVDDVSCVLETKGSHKLGHYMPGTRIQVVEETEERLCLHADFALLLSHHIADELKPALRSKGFGGKFIVPLPEVRIE